MVEKSVLLALAIVCFVQVNAQSKVPSANKVMQTAYKQAKKEKKNVLLMFHASWCGWCKRMDQKMNDPSTKAYFDSSFVTTHLTVLESKDKKALENPGAMEMMTQYKGGKSGIPYWLIFTPKGELLADSRDAKGQNLGCPATKEEVDQFLVKLEKGSKITASQKMAVAKAFTQTK